MEIDLLVLLVWKRLNKIWLNGGISTNIIIRYLKTLSRASHMYMDNLMDKVVLDLYIVIIRILLLVVFKITEYKIRTVRYLLNIIKEVQEVRQITTVMFKVQAQVLICSIIETFKAYTSAITRNSC